MKTAPSSRNRRPGQSRSRPTVAHLPLASQQRDTSEVPSAPVARHTAEASSGHAAPPASSRAAFLRSFVYAWAGIVYTVRTQRNMRVHIALGIVAVALGIWLRVAPVEFAMLFVAITGVVVSEMINTVAEACVDLATQEYHPLAKIAKDVAAGAVLLSAMLAVVIACFVFLPHLWPLALRLLGH